MAGSETRNSGRNVSGRTVTSGSGVRRINSAATGTSGKNDRISTDRARSTAGADKSNGSNGVLNSTVNSEGNKNPRKPKRAMKKQARRTVAGLLLASAIVVASIPTPGAQASIGTETPAETIKVSLYNPMYDSSVTYASGYSATSGALLTNYQTSGATSATTYESKVPISTLNWVSDKERTVYTSGDGKFQFVYMRRYETDSDRYAVILGYSGSDTDLTIPDSLEGYLKYTDNVSNTGYCLVAKNGEFLYYQTYEQKVVANQKYYTITFSEDANYNGVSYSQNQKLEDIGGNELEDVDGTLYLVTYKTVPTTTGYQLIADPSQTITVAEYEALDDTEKANYSAIVTNTSVKVYHSAAPYYIYKYNPCYYSSISSWQGLADADLFYKSGTDTYTQVGDNNDEYNRINATVAYIGQEYLENGGSTGTWKVGGVITTPNQGVFAEKSSITNLTIGESMQGIGDFAFYGCSTLNGVKFSSSLETIGNGAFSECINLRSCDIAPNANLLAIGKDAFYDCRSLTSFSTNLGLRAIGDSCFENCTGLSNVYLNGENSGGIGGEVALQTLGNHIFRNCTSLQGIELPRYYGESVPLEADTFEGCTSLQYIRITNPSTDFDAFHFDGKTEKGATRGSNNRWTYSDAGSFPKCTENNWEAFLNTVPDSFYFEGPASSNIHDTCLAESISFKYLDEDRYERKVYEIDERDSDPPVNDAWKSAAVLYQINSMGEVLQASIVNRVNEDGTEMSGSIQSKPINLTIPEKIGPYGIDTIGESAFANNCYFTKVTIPATVTNIGDRAFAGCHNLETVIFSDATKVQNIGTDAFKTQDCSYSASGTAIKCNICQEELGNYPSDEITHKATELTFCGAMTDSDTNTDTVPFIYAMNGVSKINNSAQTGEYIRYHSGWPTNLVVQYDYNGITNQGEVQLVEYPRYSSYANAHDFCASLPYLDEANDPGTFAYYEDLVGNAVSKYTAYKSDPANNPAPTDNEWALINAALNIVVPENVDSIKEGIFSGAKYDSDGYPMYIEPGSGSTTYVKTYVDSVGNTTTVEKTDGLLLYSDADGNLYTDAGKTSAYSGDGLSIIPYVTDADIINKEIESIQLNGVNEVDPGAFYGCSALKDVFVRDAESVGDYAFGMCTALSNATLTGPSTLGKYVFEDDSSLTTVSIGPNLSDTGVRPFRGCDSISSIDTSSNPYYDYENGLLIRTNGGTTEIVECMESRKNIIDTTTNPSLASVTSIKDEAFMDCDGLKNVDLSEADLTTVPYRCFRDDDRLYEVTLGQNVNFIDEEAFYNNPILDSVTIPNGNVQIKNNAFSYDSSIPTKTGDDRVTLYVPENSNAIPFAQTHTTEVVYDDALPKRWKVYFYENSLFGYDEMKPVGYEWVLDGNRATAGSVEVPTHDGYTFTGWLPDITTTTITEKENGLRFVAQYDGVVNEYTVTFYDIYKDVTGSDGSVTVEPGLVQVGSTQTIVDGGAVTLPDNPSHTGYTFLGWTWNPSDPTSGGVHADTIAYASYKNGLINSHEITYISGRDNSIIGVAEVADGGKTIAPAAPTYSGYTFEKWVMNPADFDFNNVTTDATVVAVYKANTSGGGGGEGGSATPTPTPTGSGSSSSSATATPTNGTNSGDNAKKYTVTVSGGSGTGSYAAGAIVPINAYDMGSGQTFDKWTSSTAGVGFANPTSPSTYFVMPANNVAVTATYKAGGSGSAATTGAGGENSGTGTRTATANPTGSTQVDISKSGISNRNVAGATVSGSTDNFIVKITDDQHASDMALQALQNAYGDITRVKYLPMDISLYDSTGRTKITDTTGLAVGITMPLPDELAPYAGNNKIASTENGTLDNLNSRFTTVDGVPCISFTATHFSPYVIYVDTANLTESTIDYTPKTGDPIHPKWFLSIGLAAVAVVLFFKKDKKIKVGTV